MLPALVAHGAAGDFAIDDTGAQIVPRGIGVPRNVQPLKHHQKFRFAPIQTDEHLIERLEANAHREYPFKRVLALVPLLMGMPCQTFSAW